MDASPSLYGVLVGPPSTAKSDIAEEGLRVISNYQVKLETEYSIKYTEYEQELLYWKSLKPRERQQMGFAKPKEPKLEQALIDKTTPQAFGDALMYNRRSVTFFKDEIASLIRNVNGDMKGDLLKCWKNSWYAYSTKTRGHQKIYTPFLNIFGTTQPKQLEAFTKNMGMESGFSIRFLYAFPESTGAVAYKSVSNSVKQEYYNIIDNLLNLKTCINQHGNPEPTALGFDPVAFRHYETWRVHFSQVAAGGDDLEREIMGKMELYSLRFALILQLMYWAAGEDNKKSIGLRAVEGAIKLTKYFLQSSIMAHQQMVTPAKANSKKVDPISLIGLFNSGESYKSIKAAGIAHERDVSKAIKMFPNLLTQEAKSRLKKFAS